ncbi:cell division/cell wall cluster transcriptional repressor MraZ [Candidatus Uhrbacteria bacterium RIFOXYC2_FULL_47_19]|uniref:Transcriptional regulator MraZ n=1 Tax=Candidatus Uhrbacteria bacterium RIFOXYC2_FULL_47_19 TaxID=1802424 RepID=A0A1F7WFN4_9BACT|nr:MAG: cell division/cell wall cluster transcriptional repressor MraZ [Candidatus Uhrbacteria bacterium RIFOXYC2_FULL_47_19]
MFIGEYQHAIDGKGRLAIPAKFRKQLARQAVVTRGLDNCLFVYPLTEWKELAEKLAALPMSQANSRAFARLMLAGAMDVDMDSQGRVLLPEYLREYAGLKKETVVVGLFNRLEIWDRTVWEKYRTKTEKQAEQIAEQMGELGV